MRRLLSAVLALALALPAIAGGDLAKKFDKAEAYLSEVENHLAKSYIERERVAEAALVEACKAGFAKAAGDETFKKLKVSFRKEVLAISQDEKVDSIAKLLGRIERAAEKAEISDLDIVAMSDFGASSMVQSIQDPFSNLLKSEDLQKLMKQMQGEGRTDSIGVGLEPDKEGMKVSFVMYGYAAYDAGLRIGDVLTEVDGEPLAGKILKEVQPRFATKEGESIVLTVKREGWKKAYDITVTNSARKIKDVWSTMLPGGIGYIRLTIFDLALGTNTLKACEELKKEGMKALILDLRNNPGGALPAAIHVADTFISGQKLITYTESNLDMSKVMPFPVPGIADQKPEMEYRAKRKSDFEKMPMVCLVNESSASASEMLSGALQDLGRAVLVGEKTYGKGIGQTAIPLWKSQGADFGKSAIPMLPNRFLYLTVMRYFLPSGRTIHHHGVEPDVRVKVSLMGAETWDGVYALRRSGKARKFAAGLEKDAIADLAVYDGFDVKSYPGFEGFYKSLKTKLSKDEVREELRREVRLRAGGNAALVDLQTDTQLQRGLTILAEKLGFSPEDN
ncbi:MAG: PDZ domain-containing protein [Planctomycetes bacterium]|nr:PDZ domain-containing protein [Planctomycetota bacterium]